MSASGTVRGRTRIAFVARIALAALALAPARTHAAPLLPGAGVLGKRRYTPPPPPPKPHDVPPTAACPALPDESTGDLIPIPPGYVEEAAPALRLPQDARPMQEALSLTLDPAQARFSGVAAIALELDKPRSVLWLHGRGLHVTEAHLDMQGARLPVDYQQVNDGGLVRVRVPCLISGRALLTITWDAPYGEHLAGIYVAHENGVPYVYSQFEAIDARRAFPSFDEPFFKIPWDVELLVPADDVAVSNGATASERREGPRKRVRFTTTPPLPSYLLAFAVGPFDVVTPEPLPPNDVRDRPLAVRGIAPKGRGPELQFALEANAALLPWLESWFGIAYPYEKLDQIAVPDFTYGAMENAGAITYREADLLYRKGISGQTAEAVIATTLAHEVAHQWFGDLVTLRWWNDTWLNESFATWMERKAVDGWRPELRAGMDQLAAIHHAMASDATSTARAIRHPVEDESGIWNQFDALTYDKGAGLLAMMESWAGKEQFRAGIQHYLRSHVDGGGSSEDLFDAIGEASGRSIAGPLRSFLDQAGVPVLRARVSCGTKVKLLLQQSRDLPVGADATPQMKAQRWQIPVCVHEGLRGEVHSACTLLTEEKGELELSGTRCPDWVMPNAAGVGYYRFNLDANDLQALGNGRGQLSASERASLTANLVAAYQQGTQPAAEVIRELAGFVKDREPEVGNALMGVLADAHARILEPKLRPALEQYAQEVYGPLAAKLGWTEAEGESPAVRADRVELLHFLADTARDPGVRSEGARLGKAYANLEQDGFEPAAVAPDLSGLALALEVQEGGEPVRSKLIARLANSADPAVRRRILGALGSLRDPALTPELLALTFDRQLHQSERAHLIFLQLAHEETRAAATVWLVAHWDALTAQVPDEAMAGLVRALASLGCDAGTVAAAEGFLRPRAAKIDSASIDLEQGLETARLCIARREAQGKSLDSFFAHPPPAKH